MAVAPSSAFALNSLSSVWQRRHAAVAFTRSAPRATLPLCCLHVNGCRSTATWRPRGGACASWLDTLAGDVRPIPDSITAGQHAWSVLLLVALFTRTLEGVVAVRTRSQPGSVYLCVGGGSSVLLDADHPGGLMCIVCGWRDQRTRCIGTSRSRHAYFRSPRPPLHDVVCSRALTQCNAAEDCR